ncbi:hypothetical protein IVB69_00360 [Flavobacterium sp. J49]|uniref:hypothetical protein n=1 Tax=Flavobacterium sp. J49 TaxID=2718534 RepID=UPI00159397E2|nr:hypothetical protein [Flavobacterium sp. J49]MBF6639920.1 hypothetical protein [Flavobacterium sp. J49]NIC01165.1 hypothetical protein [Flavobacterium sp. J49]
MKIIKSLLAIAAFFAINSASAQTISERWPEIKAYHEVISKSFHSSEEGNLNPIKLNSELLVERAEALAVENMPEEYRTPKLIESIVVLKKETKKVNDLVQRKAGDEEIKKALASLHDTFHKIVGLCQTEKK